MNSRALYLSLCVSCIASLALTLVPFSAFDGPLVYGQPAAEQPFLPLKPGTTWVYRGTVRWFDMQADKDDAAEVALTMKIEKIIHRPGLTLAVVSGFPADLDWGTGEAEPKPFLWVETEKREVFLDPAPPDFDYSKLEDKMASLKPFLSDDNLFFRWPLKKGMKFGDPEQFHRSDNKYCWFVDEQTKKDLLGIQGADLRGAEVSTLRFVTNPDDTTVELAPGIGVLSYEYHHHGTTADTSVRLVEFHPATALPATSGAKP